MHHWIAWNILFRAQELAKRHRTFRILREMEAADQLSASALEGYRLEKLREFLSYCSHYVPYYRSRFSEYGIDPAHIRDVGELGVLPPLNKADIRKYRADLRSTIARDLTPFTTGGSTGEPLIFDIARRRTAARVACRQRVSRWWNLSTGDAEIALWGSPIEITRQRRVQDLRDRLLATRLLPAFEMSSAMITNYLDLLEAGKWRQIFGYPSAIYLLCREASKQGRDLRRVGFKAAFVTGEVLWPYQREFISSVLGCPVANGYGGRDSGFIAHECPQGGMHILADCVVVEILDERGHAANPGEAGEIVVTDLYSHEAPFIRYRTGDVGAFSSRKCACGRALPLLERIEGRSNDLVVTPDGRLINSLALIYAIREVAGVEHFRIRQKLPDSFHVEIVRNQQYAPDAEERIRRGWSQLMRSPVAVTFDYLPSLAAEKSGKFRHVLSDIAEGRSLCQPRMISRGGVATGEQT